MVGNLLPVNMLTVEKSSENPNSQWMGKWSWGWELNPLQPRDFTRTTLFSLHIWQEPDKVGT
jgi:hypothetical protein